MWIASTFAGASAASAAVQVFGDKDVLGTAAYAVDPTLGAVLEGLPPGRISGGQTGQGHGFPFAPDAGDFPGTDRIYTGSQQTAFGDGYSGSPLRVAGPQVFVLDCSALLPAGQSVASLTLGIAADDFQAPAFHQFFRVTINGQRSTALENLLNSLDQTGPVVRFFTIGLDPALLGPDKTLRIAIDQEGDGRDGWAVDFLTVGISDTVAQQSGGTRVFDGTILGSDAIFLAGRADLTVPPLGSPWLPGDQLQRFGNGDSIVETFPPFVAVRPGDVIRVLDTASGGINFFQGLGPPFFGPAGDGTQSSLDGLGRLSGYRGPAGALVGVFLDDSIPSGTGAPPTLDFLASGIGSQFSTLAPALGQIFYIGGGAGPDGQFRTYLAPPGATRLFLGIPDGFSFAGAPGYYNDNDGGYRIALGVNEIPIVDAGGDAPFPAWALLALGVALAGRISRAGRGRLVE